MALPAAYGDRIELSATYQPSEPPRNPHAFDYAAFLRQNGIETSMRTHITRVQVLEARTGNPLTALALRAKTHFLETFKRSIRSPASRIAAASTLGARRAVERVTYRDFDIAEMFRHAGVGHVLAVSGLHVSVIAVLLFALFRLTGASPRVFVPPLIFFLILFALLTGARPSSVRAVLMNSVILFTIAYFRCNLRTATAIGLSASAFVILLNNPLLLFAPSFLLSYGAVLSLIVLAPPFDRFLCALRGFSAMLFLGWFALLMGIAGWRFHWLTHPGNIVALGGLLWILLMLGGRLNHALPRMWNTGFIRMHPLLRMFVAAQLAIQIGMMLPMSAWFFGRFPVAGILVNLAAIPTVGILVQLGMLLGIVGMIPMAGSFLALPLGAATAVVGEFFLLIAYAGARTFPFPATPQPSASQLGIYYLLVAFILFAEQNRHILLDRIYRMTFWHQAPSHKRALARLSAPSILIIVPLVMQGCAKPMASHMQILAGSRYPLITLQGKHRADLIHAGNRFQGSRLLFDHLRAKGATVIENIYLPSPDPRAGIEGSTALAETLPIQRVLLPLLPAPDQSFTEAIGDTYLIRSASEGVPWAQHYNTAFEQLLLAHQQNRNPRHIDVLANAARASHWNNVTIRPLPIFAGNAQRFLASARTPLLHAHINGIEWIIITDTLPDALSEAMGHVQTCRVLVASDLSTRAAFFTWLQKAVEHLTPEILIIGGDEPISWTQQQQEWLTQKETDGLHIFQTGLDGAITVQLPRRGGLQMKTHVTQRQLTLQQETAK